MNEARRLKALENENSRLKRLLADAGAPWAGWTCGFECGPEGTPALKKLVKPAAKRQAAQHCMTTFGLSQRRACRLVGLQRCVFCYRSRRSDDAIVRQRLKQLAQNHPRWGYRFLGVLLRREGFRINLKRVLRLYREEGLKLRPKRRKKVVNVQRIQPPETTDINQKWTGAHWAGDFMSDTLSCGRRFRALTIVDCNSRECLALEVDISLSGERVVRVLERLRETAACRK